MSRLAWSVQSVMFGQQWHKTLALWLGSIGLSANAGEKQLVEQIKMCNSKQNKEGADYQSSGGTMLSSVWEDGSRDNERQVNRLVHPLFVLFSWLISSRLAGRNSPPDSESIWEWNIVWGKKKNYIHTKHLNLHHIFTRDGHLANYHASHPRSHVSKNILW